MSFRTGQSRRVVYYRPPIYGKDNYGVESNTVVTNEINVPNVNAYIRNIVDKDYVVSCKKLEESPSFTARYLEVMCRKSKQIHEVKHIHFHQWDDFKIPSNKSPANIPYTTSPPFFISVTPGCNP